jgi:hypothetical protein
VGILNKGGNGFEVRVTLYNALEESLKAEVERTLRPPGEPIPQDPLGMRPIDPEKYGLFASDSESSSEHHVEGNS